MTTAANDIVRPVHAKAMPVLLTPGQFDQWLDGSVKDAMALAAPLDSAAMEIVPQPA